mgnify:CR=1 FL=1
MLTLRGLRLLNEADVILHDRLVGPDVLALARRDAERIEIENIASPGHVMRVDKAKYDAMKDALLAVVPRDTPGLTVAEIKAGVLPLLPDDLFPGGAKAGWWLKAAQLDLEAKRVIARAGIKPLRLHKM